MGWMGWMRSDATGVDDTATIEWKEKGDNELSTFIEWW